MIRVGTSGFVYPHFRPVLYGALPASRWLAHYAAHFDTVELNATFYRLPTATSAASWRAETPARFRFAAKGSRYLTHMKRLLDRGPGLDRYFTPLAELGDKLAVVLWQLPPQMVKVDLPRLDAFLSALPRTCRHAVEFRSESWYRDDVAALLERHRAAFCEHDLVQRPVPARTGGFRYLRFHGATAPYAGRYGARRLRAVAESLTEGGPAWVFFNNDLGGHAVRDAITLRSLLGQVPPRHRVLPRLASAPRGPRLPSRT